MNRRLFLSAVLFLCICDYAIAANHKFIFRVKTKSGGIVGNILIEAADMDAAKFKLMKRYPGCTVLNAKQK
jgi:hypothetical protein